MQGQALRAQELTQESRWLASYLREVGDSDQRRRRKMMSLVWNLSSLGSSWDSQEDLPATVQILRSSCVSLAPCSIAFSPLFGSVVLWWIWKNRWPGALFAVYIRQLSSESFPYILTFMSRHSQKMIMSVFWHWGPGVTFQGVCEFLLCLWSACNVVLDNTTQQYPALFSCVCILFTQQDYVMPCMD